MGKKKNKKSFAKQNRVLLAALGGVAAGISLAGILGTEKAKKIVDTLGSSLNDFTGRMKDEIKWKTNNAFPQDAEIKNRKTADVESM